MSEQRTPTKDEAKPSMKPLYARSVLNSLGTEMVNPFMGAYAVNLGASSSDVAWFQSSSNLSNNVMQILWGRMSDRLKHRISFIVVGGLIVSVLWVPMIFVAEAYQLIILLAVQALLGSMAVPAWTALIGDLVPSNRLGKANASIGLWASTGSLIATMGSAVVMVFVGGTFREMIFFPLTAATAFGLMSSLVMFRIREKKNGESGEPGKKVASGLVDMARLTRRCPDFARYCYVDGVFQFFMSMGWPLFTITQVTVLKASVLQLALLSVVQMFVMIIFQNWAGRKADTAGRKPLLVFLRFALITVPIAYALVPDINLLIAIDTFWGFANALGQAAITAYLLDIAPEEYRGSFTAIFNLSTGIITFSGSLIGGYLSDYLTGLYGLITGMNIVYLISTIGRTAGAGLHFTLRETLRR